MHKIMRTLVVGAVAAGLLVSTVTAAAPAQAAPEPKSTTETAVSFTDVAGSHKFYREISWMGNTGISTGTKTGSTLAYKPGDATTREAMAAFLYRLASPKAFKAPKKSPFIDVSTKHKFYKQIAWMHASGISTGTRTAKGLRYDPKQTTSREAMAAFLFRMAKPKHEVPAKSPFIDVSTKHKFYRQITWMRSSGLSTGSKTPQGQQYKPADSTSREAMAAFLYRFSAEQVPADEDKPAQGEVTIAPEAKELSAKQLDSLEKVVPLGDGGASLTLPTNQAGSIHPGDVLVAGFSDATPDGLIVRVDSVTRTGASTTFRAESAALTDVVMDTGGLVKTKPVQVGSRANPAEGVVVTTPTARSGEALPNAKVDFSESFEYKKTLTASKTGQSGLTGTGTVSFKHETEFGVSAEADLDIAFFKLKQLRVEVTPKIELTDELTASFEASGEKEFPLGSFTQAFVVPLGIPIPMTTEEDFSLTLSLDGKVEFKSVKKRAIATTFGIGYNAGKDSAPKPIYKAPKLVTESAGEPTGSGTLDLKAALGAKAGIKLAGVAGLYATVAPYQKTIFNTTFKPGTFCTTLEFGVDWGVGLEVSAKKWGIPFEWTPLKHEDTVKLSQKLPSDACYEVKAGKVEITGSPVLGGTLTAKPVGWTSEKDITYKYQWLRAGKAISGATAATYKPVSPTDTGAKISVSVTGSIKGNNPVTKTSDPVTISAFVAGTVSISGTPEIGETLVANLAGWQPAGQVTFTYQWLLNGNPLYAANASSYQIDNPSVIGGKISVKVTGSLPGATPKVANSSAISVPEFYGTGTVSGTLQVPRSFCDTESCGYVLVVTRSGDWAGSSSKVGRDGRYSVTRIGTAPFRLRYSSAVKPSTTAPPQFLSVGETTLHQLAPAQSKTVNASVSDSAASLAGRASIAGVPTKHLAAARAGVDLRQRIGSEWVLVSAPRGTHSVAGDVTATDYSAKVLPGEYRVEFTNTCTACGMGGPGPYPQESLGKQHDTYVPSWWQNANSFDRATSIIVRAGEKRTGINGSATYKG